MKIDNIEYVSDLVFNHVEKVNELIRESIVLDSDRGFYFNEKFDFSLVNSLICGSKFLLELIQHCLEINRITREGIENDHKKGGDKK